MGDVSCTPLPFAGHTTWAYFEGEVRLVYHLREVSYIICVWFVRGVCVHCERCHFFVRDVRWRYFMKDVRCVYFVISL